MEEGRNVTNNFEAGSNCQVFNAPISGCVFAMPGSNVTQQSTPSTSQISGEVLSAELEGDPTKATGMGYISHFATCPNADKHRKR